MVEVKCPLCAEKSSLKKSLKTKEIFALKHALAADGSLQLKHDHSYFYQCQLQMYVTQRGYCDFVVWTSEELQV